VQTFGFPGENLVKSVMMMDRVMKCVELPRGSSMIDTGTVFKCRGIGVFS
jgi:hypothetical protein